MFSAALWCLALVAPRSELPRFPHAVTIRTPKPGDGDVRRAETCLPAQNQEVTLKVTYESIYGWFGTGFRMVGQKGDLSAGNGHSTALPYQRCYIDASANVIVRWDDRT
jgi:hypothetical protein